MRHWLWIPVALATGCFSEPAESVVSTGTETDADGSTGPATTDGTISSGAQSSTGGVGSTDPTEGTEGTDESSETTDDPDSSSTTAAGPACGNGVVEGDEHCDGEDPQGSACLDDCTITCLDHFEDCDEIPAGGCEIDTATDGNNCGECGHICASGECHDSVCAPAAIAEGIGFGPTRITRVGDTFVFDESGFGRILRWDLGSEDVQELVSDDLTGSFRRFAVADGSVFWLDLNDDAAQRVPLDGGTVDFMFPLEDGGSPFASPTHLYYPTTASVEGLPISTLLQATHEAPAATTALVSDVPGLMCQVVEAAGRIVWAGTDSDSPVRSVPVGGGAAVSHSVFTADACNRPMFAVGPSIYLYGSVLEAGPFGIIRHNLANNTSSMIIPEVGFGNLGDYFVSADGILADVDGEVRAYDLQGDDPVVVAAPQPDALNSTGRYLDDQVVLWTEVQGNTWTLFVNERT